MTPTQKTLERLRETIEIAQTTMFKEWRYKTWELETEHGVVCEDGPVACWIHNYPEGAISLHEADAIHIARNDPKEVTAMAEALILALEKLKTVGHRVEPDFIYESEQGISKGEGYLHCCEDVIQDCNETLKQITTKLNEGGGKSD